MSSDSIIAFLHFRARSDVASILPILPRIFKFPVIHPCVSSADASIQMIGSLCSPMLCATKPCAARVNVGDAVLSFRIYVARDPHYCSSCAQSLSEMGPIERGQRMSIWIDVRHGPGWLVLTVSHDS